MDPEEDTEENIDKQQEKRVRVERLTQLCNEVQDISIGNSADEAEEEKSEIGQDIKQKAIIEQWLSLKKEALLKDERRLDVAFNMEKVKREITNEACKAEIEAKKCLTKIEDVQLFLLHKSLEVNQRCHDSSLNENKKRAENAIIGIQHVRDTEQALDEMNEALIEERTSTERDIERLDGILSQYTHCRDILFKMSTVDRQEAQTAKANETSGVEDDNFPALFISAPEDLLDIMMELTEQNMSLIQNTPKVDDTLEKLNQSIVNTVSKTEEAEKKVNMQILDLRERVDVIKPSTTKLKQRVILYDSLKTADEDIMLNALREQISKTYSKCIDGLPQHHLSTLEMVAKIEIRMGILLDRLESIPKDFVEEIMKIKESEKRSRQQEEQLRLERQKKEERLQRCLERSLKATPRKLGRKLMPRCIPVESHTKEEENVESEEDELEVFMFRPQKNIHGLEKNC